MEGVFKLMGNINTVGLNCQQFSFPLELEVMKKLQIYSILKMFLSLWLLRGQKYYPRGCWLSSSIVVVTTQDIKIHCPSGEFFPSSQKGVESFSSAYPWQAGLCSIVVHVPVAHTPWISQGACKNMGLDITAIKRNLKK